MPVEIERKFLLTRPPSLRALERLRADIIHIDQTYLDVDGPARVRVRRSRRDGVTTYTHTAKRKIGFGVRDESETEITKNEYRALLSLADPTRRPIRKRRHVFGFSGLIFELDEILAPRRLWLLEVELPTLDHLHLPLSLPPRLPAATEVTGSPRYSNAALARRCPDPR